MVKSQPLLHSFDVSKTAVVIKGRCQNSLPLTTNFSQKLTQPSKGISYPVGDLCGRFTKLTLPCAYTLHGNQIPSTDGTNGLLLHTYHKHVSPACFCHSIVGNFDVSPKAMVTYCMYEWTHPYFPLTTTGNADLL